MQLFSVPGADYRGHSERAGGAGGTVPSGAVQPPPGLGQQVSHALVGGQEDQTSHPGAGILVVFKKRQGQEVKQQ